MLLWGGGWRSVTYLNKGVSGLSRAPGRDHQRILQGTVFKKKQGAVSGSGELSDSQPPGVLFNIPHLPSVPICNFVGSFF